MTDKLNDIYSTIPQKPDMINLSFFDKYSEEEKQLFMSYTKKYVKSLNKAIVSKALPCSFLGESCWYEDRETCQRNNIINKALDIFAEFARKNGYKVDFSSEKADGFHGLLFPQSYTIN